MVLRLEIGEVRQKLESDVEALIIKAEKRNKNDAMQNIMNLSPTFDKKSPTLWRIPKEPRTYMKISQIKKNQVIELND